jgi:adhesin transport system membrane fusion protein
MPATIKLTAYDYTIYGSFKGKVLHVSADTFEKPNARDSEPYYKVLIKLDTLSPTAKLEEVEIRPGMLADSELQVGKQTVLSYLVKPLFKASQAFKEP